VNAAARDAIRRTTAKWLQPSVLGRVTEVAGTLVQISVTEKNGPVLGDVLEVETSDSIVPCEIVGFRGSSLLAIPLVPARNIAAGAPARPTGRAASVAVGDALLGRVIDPFGLPMDGGPQPRCTDKVPLDAGALPIDQRGTVCQRFDTGVRVIDGLLTCGRGQRVGIFAGAGCGKSVLVEQIASQADADVIVIGLIGERGREVVELMGSQRRSKMIIAVAAEYFRDRGKNVLLVIDSLTRFAMATREIGLALGEPPATKGYPPSVFANMPRLLERVAPRAGSGSITAFYTVLVEGDDLSDPIADSARSLLDAHVVLSRDLAGRGHFPAVDILSSASRVARRVASPAAVALASRAREQLAQRKQAQELQALGAYTMGVNKDLDHAMAIGHRIDSWARQTPEESSTYELALTGLTAALESK